MVLPSIRHSRAGGNPGLFSRPISLDTRFRGYDGTRAASSFCRSSLHTYFQRRHEEHKEFSSRAKSVLSEPEGTPSDAPCHFDRREKSFLDPAIRSG